MGTRAKQQGRLKREGEKKLRDQKRKHGNAAKKRGTLLLKPERKG